MQKIGLPAGQLRLALPPVAGAGSFLSRLPKRILGIHAIFFIGVIVPTALAALYYGVFATDQYVSEAQFVVRSTNHRPTTGLSALFQTFGLSQAVDDANAVQSYMLSRDALRALNAKLALRDMFGGRHADILSRFPRPWTSDSEESLFSYYQSRVAVLQKQSQGITTLSVQAFTAADAQSIAQELLNLAEGMVNQMNSRAERDAIHYAEADLEASQKALVEAQRALTDFRTHALMIDPSSSSVSVLDTITQLSTDLARAGADVQEAEGSTGSSPALPSLEVKVAALKERIAQERAKLAGDEKALAPQVAAYDQLNLAKQFAERRLGNADAALQTARMDARRQQIYLERVVSPQLSDESTEPQRLRMILTVLVLCFGLASVCWILTAGASEHAIE